jgi:plastocyanin
VAANEALRAMLEARSVAVVGASPRLDSPGNHMVRQLIIGGFSGEVAAQKVEVRVAPGGRLAWERSEYYATAGDATFVVSSPAGQAHNFTVEGPGVQAQSRSFAGGTTQRYTLKGMQPGTYRIVCTLPGHREAGMVATLYVR